MAVALPVQASPPSQRGLHRNDKVRGEARTTAVAEGCVTDNCQATV